MIGVKNFMEDFTFGKLREHLPHMDVCQCDICRADIAAIILNALPPKYVVTEAGEVYGKASLMQLQSEVDFIKELARAVEIVRKAPRHP